MNSLISSSTRTLLLLLVIGLIAGLGYTIGRQNRSNGNEVVVPDPVPAETETVPTKLITSNVEVDQPTIDATITSPITIKGRARGTWFFEASFPINVIDANGRVLGQGIATAESDWMTTEFVPFSATITFSAPTTSTGKIVLEKDNPSGLPEHADSVSLTVSF